MKSFDTSALLKSLGVQGCIGVPRFIPATEVANAPVMEDPEQPGMITPEIGAAMMQSATQPLLLPRMARFAPPPLDDEEDIQLSWVYDNLPVPEVIWDPYMCQPMSKRIANPEARALMAKAFHSTLSSSQHDQLLAALEADRRLVHRCGMTPKLLPDLIENNPLVALEVLLKLVASTQIGEYLAVMASMEISMHSMEVVSRLSMTVELPSEFLHLYIENCISSCQRHQDDKYQQNRLVRLVCVFLQSLVRNKVISVKDLASPQVQAFTVEFRHIKEASSHYSLLRTM